MFPAAKTCSEQSQRRISSVKDTYFWDQLGLSCLFSDFFQNKARYCNTDKCWYIFDSEIGWQKDVGRKKLKKLVFEFKRKILYAESLIDNGKAKESFHKNFYGMLLTDSQYHALADASSEDYSFSASEMDTAIDSLAVQNGVIKLNRDGTFDFHTFTPEDMTTMHMATVYDPKAKCPTWERFINEVLGGDQEIIQFFKIFIGQTLYGHNDQKAFGILYTFYVRDRAMLLSLEKRRVRRFSPLRFFAQTGTNG